MDNEENDRRSVDLNIEEFSRNVSAEEPGERPEEHSSHQIIDVTTVGEYKYDSQKEFHCNTRLYGTNNLSNVIQKLTAKMEPVANLEKIFRK